MPNVFFLTKIYDFIYTLPTYCSTVYNTYDQAQNIRTIRISTLGFSKGFLTTVRREIKIFSTIFLSLMVSIKFSPA